MRSKRLLYPILLFLSITIRIIFYYFPFEGTFLERIGKSQLLYDVIFFAIMISLLEQLKDRKWLIGLTWITLIDAIAYSVFGWVQDVFSPLPEHQYALYHNIMGIPPLVFYICIFFARKSPARFYFRCMTLVTVIPIIYGICSIIFHFPSPFPWMTSPGAIVLDATLLNLLLLVAVLRTPELRRTEYAEFME